MQKPEKRDGAPAPAQRGLEPIRKRSARHAELWTDNCLKWPEMIYQRGRRG